MFLLQNETIEFSETATIQIRHADDNDHNRFAVPLSINLNKLKQKISHGLDFLFNCLGVELNSVSILNRKNKILQMHDRVEDLICEQSLADMMYFTENDGKLRLDNFSL